mmetsp:Transcript_6531/g.5612  ORF Transcript_6531/g.5612 Transcript_6531/m.5612 type:complete len:114 (+) Transcript_6531:205-546(+)
MHFFYLPDNEYYHQFSEVEDHLLKRKDAGDSSESSDSDSDEPYTGPKRPVCLSYYREYRNIEKKPITQIEYFGDVIIFTHELCMTIIAPFSETEYLQCKQMEFKNEEGEFEKI